MIRIDLTGTAARHLEKPFLQTTAREFQARLGFVILPAAVAPQGVAADMPRLQPGAVGRGDADSAPSIQEAFDRGVVMGNAAQADGGEEVGAVRPR